MAATGDPLEKALAADDPSRSRERAGRIVGLVGALLKQPQHAGELVAIRAEQRIIRHDEELGTRVRRTGTTKLPCRAGACGCLETTSWRMRELE